MMKAEAYVRKHQRCNLVKQQGMTLLELLVATGILVVVSGMAFLSLDTLVKSKQSLQQTTDDLNQFNLTQFQFQDDIQMAVTTNHPVVAITAPEFIADSQSITLLRYSTATVPIQRNNNTGNQRANGLNQQRLIRVRWYVRNQQWIRATQSAASSLNSNQWQERPMLSLQSLNCNYQNLTGLTQSIWPENQTQNIQLPELISCQVTQENNEVSMLKLVPWQRAGWL